ncbi:MAG: hypothetical protein ACK5JT_15715 [Hyphomicrobiaceae bacterium]
MAASSTNDKSHASSAGDSALTRSNVLILDVNVPAARRLRDDLEDGFAAHVEIVDDLDEALDVLGNANRPVSLVMADTVTDGGACVSVLRLLIQHRAHVALTLHGAVPPEAFAVPANLMGAAAFTTDVHLDEAVPTAARVLRAQQDVATIMADAIVPPTLDPVSAMAIYGAPPGDTFDTSFQA